MTRRVMAALLSWGLMLLLTVLVTCLLGQALLTGGLYTAADQAEVLPLQRQRVSQAVEEQATAYHMDAEPLQALLTEALFTDATAQAADWLSSLLTAQVAEPPVFTVPGVEALALEDEGFQAQVSLYEQRVVARDVVSAQVDKAFSAAVLPLRAEALTALRSRVTLPDGLTKWLTPSGLGQLALWAASAALLCAALLYALHGKNWPRALHWLGAALSAAGLLWLIFALLLWLAKIPQQAAEVSAIAGAMAQAIQGHVLTRLCVPAALALALGFTGMELARRKGA